MLTPFAYKPLAFALKNRHHAPEMQRLSPWLHPHRFRATGKSVTQSLLLEYELDKLEAEAQLAITGRKRVFDLLLRDPSASKTLEPMPLIHYDEVAFFKA